MGHLNVTLLYFVCEIHSNYCAAGVCDCMIALILFNIYSANQYENKSKLDSSKLGTFQLY